MSDSDIAAALTGNRLDMSITQVHGDLQTFQCHIALTALSGSELVMIDPDAECVKVNAARTKSTVRGPVRHMFVQDAKKWPYTQTVVTGDKDICVFSDSLESAMDLFVKAGMAIFIAGWIRATQFK